MHGMSTRQSNTETLTARMEELERKMRELGEEVEDLSLALFLEERIRDSSGMREPLESVAAELGLDEALEGGR